MRSGFAGALSAAPQDTQPEPGDERYQDLGPLGAGGMGEVRRVLDTKLGRVVALKTLRPEHLNNPSLRMRFLQEARATAQLTHPGIVSLHELGVLPDGRSFFTMPLIEGETLGQAFAGPGSLRKKVGLLASAAAALAYAHSRGVLHRDFKPSNVMVGRFGQVRVVDWGLVGQTRGAAEPLSGQLQGPCGVAGTPSYMSPEHARGERVDARSDVYALGATLYTLLERQRPFHGSPTRELLKRLLTGSTPTVQSGPRELQALCTRAMHPDPEQRPAHAGVFVQGLEDWLENAHARARAKQHLSHAQDQRAQVESLRSQADAAERSAAELSAELPKHAPTQARRPLWTLEDQAAELQTRAELAEVQMIQSLQAAIAEADLEQAHSALAWYYRRRHEHAEAHHDLARATRYLALLRAHDQGEHRDYLSGQGWLHLHTNVPARVRAWVYRERDRRLVPEPIAELGCTPIEGLAMESGSYLLELRAPGCEVVRLPVQIKRGERWSNRPPQRHPRCGSAVWLPPFGTLSPDEVFVPAGWYQSGDPKAKNGLPHQRVWVDDFAIWRAPFTNAEYLAFLNDLVEQGQGELAAKHAPAAMAHGAEVGEQQYGRDAQGRYILVPDAEGDLWSPQWPVVFVDSRSAQAACAWLSARRGQPWRLPWELEREKAARGVDGRRYSWGDASLAPLSANSQARPGRPTPSEVGSHPFDTSPYGLVDGCGNVRDHCLDPSDPLHPKVQGGWAREPAPAKDVWRALRGGCWASGVRLALTGLRGRCPDDHRSALNGFRPARSLTRPEDTT